MAPGRATITIQASDPDGLFAEQSFSVRVETPRPPEVALVTGAVAAPEGGAIQLEVSAHPPPLAPILVGYSVGVDDDGATPDADAADYAHAATGALQIDSGAVGAAIEIAINDDDDIEPTREVFTIVLDTPAEGAPYTLGSTSLATGTILEGVCDRTAQVRDEIVARTAAGRCEEVADSHLETIDTLNLVPPVDPHSSQGPSLTDLPTEACTRATRIAPAADGRGPSFKRMHGCPSSMRFGTPGEHPLRAGNARGGAREPITELQIGDFAGLVGLQELWLQYNELKGLEPGIFSELAELRVLYLNNNGLETLDSDLFSALERLQELTLYNNGLTELPADVFANLSELEGIWLHDNEFATLPAELFSSLSGLKELLVYANQLTELPAGIFSSLESLEVLALSDNQLTELDGNVFENLSSLEQLWLGENRLEGLPTGVFANLGSLTLLSLFDNRIERLESGLFDGLDQLDDLVLDRNRLTYLPSGIFADLGALRQLFVSENQIAEIQLQAFSGLSGLETLSLSDNRLTNLQRGTFDALSSLKALVLEKNPLAQLKSGLFSELANLEELWLNEARLTSLVPATFAGLSALKRLYLWENLLTELRHDALAGLFSLEELAIQQNQIATLAPEAFSGLVALKTLLAWENKLTALPPEIFSGLSQLEDLWLSDNELAALPPGVFSKMVNLRELHLNENRIVELPDSTFTGLEKLLVVNLGANPGAPFLLNATLERTDSDNLASPGPAKMVIRLAQGVPFSARIPVAVDGGELSTATVLLEPGMYESAEFTVTQDTSSQGGTEVVAGPAPRPPASIFGIEIVAADTIVLFASSGDAADAEPHLAAQAGPDVPGLRNVAAPPGFPISGAGTTARTAHPARPSRRRGRSRSRSPCRGPGTG